MDRNMVFWTLYSDFYHLDWDNLLKDIDAMDADKSKRTDELRKKKAVGNEKRSNAAKVAK